MPIVLLKSQLDLRYADEHLKWDFLRRRPEKCTSSKKANQNQDSIRGSTPNVKEGAGRLLQQNLPRGDLSRCSNMRTELRLLDHLVGAMASSVGGTPRPSALACDSSDLQYNRDRP